MITGYSSLTEKMRQNKKLSNDQKATATGAITGGILGGIAGAAIPLDELHPALRHMSGLRQSKFGLAGGALVGAGIGKITGMIKRTKKNKKQ